MAEPPQSTTRLVSLDQFRGYTMCGMLLVNFLGAYPVCPRLLRHTNDYCSYADTIMPQFLFAAGFALRLSLGRRMEAGGKMPWGRVLRRILGLALVAIVWYSLGDLPGIIARFQRNSAGQLHRPPLALIGELFKHLYFQTLLHIAATSLWILPVITRSIRVRIAFTIFTGMLHVLLSWWFNFVLVNSDPTGIDGGPLGFLTWAIPALCGTMAYDAVRAAGPQAARRITMAGLLIALAGWILSTPTVLYNTTPEQRAAAMLEIAAVRAAENAAIEQGQQVVRRNERLALDPVLPSIERVRSWDGSIVEPPFVPPPDARHREWNYWMMSQRCGSLSYLTFSAGISLVVYAFFLWACDAQGWKLGIFRTFGTNSLAAYCVHELPGIILGPYFPEPGQELVTGLSGAAHWLHESTGFEIGRCLYMVQVGGTAVEFVGFVIFVYLCCRFLERMGWHIRV